METEINVTTEQDLQRVLQAIKFKNSLFEHWDLRVEHQRANLVLEDEPEVVYGWNLKMSFLRPDVDTGIPGRGYGRGFFVATGITESALVKTVWVAFELLVKHEMMEGFNYRDARVFDPHKTMEQLALPFNLRSF